MKGSNDDFTRTALMPAVPGMEKRKKYCIFGPPIV